VHLSLPFKSYSLGEKVRIQVPNNEDDLEEEHARRPHCWCATKPGQKIFCENKLNLEQQERTQENRRRIWPNGITLSSLATRNRHHLRILTARNFLKLVTEVVSALHGTMPLMLRRFYLFISAIIALAYAGIFLANFSLYTSGEPGGFVVFYTVGKLVRTFGFRRLYDQSLQQLFHPAVVGTGGYFYHLPYEAIILVALAHFSQPVAFAIWSLVNVGGVLLGLLRLGPHLKIPRLELLLSALAFAPILIMLVQGQDSGLVCFCFALACADLLEGREGRAGVILASSLFKFQYAIPAALILAIRYRRMAVSFGATGLIILVTSLTKVGTEGFHDLLKLAAGVPERSVMMPNLRGLGAVLLRADIPWLVCLLSFILLAVAWKVVVLRDRAADNCAIAILVAWLLSYHGHFYDAVLWLIPIVLLYAAQPWAASVIPLSVIGIFFPLQLGWFALLPLMLLWKQARQTLTHPVTT
jgi:hypothetical protein